MQKGVNLVSLLLLGWAWTLQGVPVLPEPHYQAQKNFDLSRFLGSWYEVAVVSTCPRYMQRHKADPTITQVDLQNGTEGTVKVTATVHRQVNGTCSQESTDYGLTDTPGRFFYHVAQYGVDVHSYVVHTNYDEYANIIMLTTNKSSGANTTIVRLHSRTMDVTDTVLDEFKKLVRQQGISDDTIIIKQKKSDCVPGVKVTEPTTRPQKSKRMVLRSVLEEDGSGFSHNYADYGIFQDAACLLPLVTHNCTGKSPVWVFNSTSSVCVALKQDICQGNGNKFNSKSECEQLCSTL
ncbi:protein AMBP-like [Myripristis murdjan]|uniref:protein AMBP-like n=1 Tax=Myripristis murdjan TaxID=586833 RepID=UPI0011761950|nr:protein AMBP-like [Myripristis murdjan]